MPMPALPRVLCSPLFVLLTACPAGSDAPTDPGTPPSTPVYAATATSGATQTKTVNAASDAMTVKVTKDGAPLASATVTWSTTGGTLASTSTTTNASGEASNTLTSVGATAGTVTVTASSNSKSATFTISVAAAAGPPSSIAFPAKIVALDSGATASSAAVVKDANGTTLSGQSVTYTSRSTSVASVNTSGQIAGVKSGKAVIVASVTSGANTYTDSLVAVVGTPNGPIVLADMPRFDLKADTTFTVAIVADMRSSSTKLGSGKVTLTWSTSQLAYQGNAEGAQSVGATVNTNNAATGSLVIAFASSGGWGGKVELRKVTFKAASAAAATGSITATANEAYAAGTYADLLPKTLSVALPLVTR